MMTWFQVLRLEAHGSRHRILTGACGCVHATITTILAAMRRLANSLPIFGVYFLNRLLEEVELELGGFRVI